MREIKFRAWDKKNKEFVAPYNKEIIGSETEGHLKWELKGVGIDLEVIFMQYTGLKDKNGVEIYEGDIVEWNCCVHGDHKEGRGVVEYKEATGWYAIKLFESYGSDGFEQLNTWKYYIKVIGNIYENKEAVQ